MDDKITDGILGRLWRLRDEVGEPWEKTVVDVGLSVLVRSGPTGVQELAGLVTREGADQLLAIALPVKDSLNLLSVLKETGRVNRTRELLVQVGSVARIVADQLLLIALENRLP